MRAHSALGGEFIWKMTYSIGDKKQCLKTEVIKMSTETIILIIYVVLNFLVPAICIWKF
jgi:hypothetical protein